MVSEIIRKANEFDAQPPMKRLHSCPTTQKQRTAFRALDWVHQVLCSPHQDFDIPMPFAEEFPSSNSHRRLQSVFGNSLCNFSCVSVCVYT